MNIRLYIWVTSKCNLACPYCSQKYTMSQNKGYEMNLAEVRYIVDSCHERGLHFRTIELTGGEASLWKHLEAGFKQFSTICDTVTMATNGNNPERVIALGMKSWIVSASQASPEQLQKYHTTVPKGRISFNTHKHKKPPSEAMKDVLPAVCCTRVTPSGEHQVTMEYLRGKVYYCCDAFAHTEYVKVTDDIVCDFEDDFVGKFSNKDYNKEICRYCLCNQRVWNQL